MRLASMNQMTLELQPRLAERFATLREFLAHRVREQVKPAKSIAADMDMSPSMLSRKLAPGDGDTQRFNVDDLEAYLESTGDAAAVIEYLASKYMVSDEERKARALRTVEELSTKLQQALESLKS